MKGIIVIFIFLMDPHKAGCCLKTPVQSKYNRVVILVRLTEHLIQQLSFLWNVWNQTLIYEENIMRRKSRAAWHNIILNARHPHDVLFKIRNLLVIIGYVSTGGLFFIFVLRDVSLYSWHQAFTSNLHMYKQDQKFQKTLNSSVSISFYELSHNVTLHSVVWLFSLIPFSCFP